MNRLKRHRFPALLKAVTALMLAAAASPGTQARNAYAILAFSQDQSALANHVVSFAVDGTEEPKFTSAVGLTFTSTAGAYADGAYYVAATKMQGSAEIPDALYKIDLEKGTSQRVGTLNGFTAFINDMTYDLSTGRMYAVAKVNDSQSALYTIDIKNGTSAKIADLDRKFFTLAADRKGHLYAVSFMGDFCLIDKTNGNVTDVGHTGLYPEKFQSMEFDHENDILYWASLNRILSDDGHFELPRTFMATVNPATGIATEGMPLGDVQLAGLYIPYNIVADSAPRQVNDLTLKPADEGVYTATLSWTNPTVNFGGDPIKSLSKVEILRDGVHLVDIGVAQPGRNSSYKDVIAPNGGGVHTYTVIPFSIGGEGLPAEVTGFIGTDKPAKVENVTVTRLGPNSARISWDAVTAGVNGGWIKTPVYTVVRNPGHVTVAENISETQWIEPGVDTFGSFSYTITASTPEGTSEPTESPTIGLGPKLGIPYSCIFTENEFNKWDAVDSNNDGNKWVYLYMNWAGAHCAYINSAGKELDDWLISAPIEFQGNSTYRLKLNRFNVKGHKMEVCLLSDYNTASKAVTIANSDFAQTSAFVDDEFEFTVAESGDYNLAFHNISGADNSYLCISKVSIELVPRKNIAVTAFSGSDKPIIGNTYSYTATIMNTGSESIGPFSVSLIDQNNRKVATKTVTETLAAGATTRISLDWEAKTEVTSLRALAELTGDEIADDNTSEPISLAFRPVGSPEELAIGESVGNTDRTPFYFYDKNSNALNIYQASEIGLPRGRITGLRYDTRTSAAVPKNVALKVYLANTDLTKADSWIPMDRLTLVFDGRVDYQSGQGVLELNFGKAFEYDGRNLAIVTMSSCEGASASYYSGVSYPYYTSPVEGNTAYYYSSDASFAYGDKTGRKASGVSNVTLMVQTSGASIAGIVTDQQGQAVDGATVSIPELAATALTDADGAYRFDFVPNGTFSVKVEKFGYEPATHQGVTVNDADAIANISITAIPTYSVSGKVVSTDGKAVSGARVSLEGYAPLETVTGTDGSFAFTDVVSRQSSITVTKDWMAPAKREFPLAADASLGTVEMGYAHYSPANITVTDAADGKTINWSTPDTKALLRYDSGEPQGQYGFTDELGKGIMGTVFRTPMQLEKIIWQTTIEGGPHYYISVYVYALDEQGNPTGNVLYSSRNIANTDGQWMEHELPEPVSAPNGCLVALNYPGFLGIALDGESKEYPFKRNTYAYSTDYDSGEFSYLENLGLTSNLMIRAEGYAYPAENDPVAAVGEERSSMPDIFTYRLWRAKGYNPSETDWTELQGATSSTSLTDNTWGQLPPGIYSYEVATVCPDGTMSERTRSAYVLNNMYSTLNIAATTNSRSGNARGAVATLTASDGKVTATSLLSATGKATFSDLWKDVYTLTLSLDGYTTVTTAADLTATDNLELTDLQLKEIIATPVNLKVYGTPAEGYTLTWNESGEIFDDFEDMVPFTAAPAGNVGWTYVDGDGARTFAEADFDFPGRTQPMSFIAFNPKKTAPSMYDARSASHPYSGDQQLACFATVYGNDDYFISPRLTYHSPFKFGFYAKGYSQTYPETVRVGYSTTDNAPESFTWIGEEFEIPRQKWQQYLFDIPAEARYVALNSTSVDGFTLFIDDVTISSGNGLAMNTAKSGPEVSYEVSVDGGAAIPTEACSMALDIHDEADHRATVKAVYASGESALAEIVFGPSGLTVTRNDTLRVFPNPAPGYTNIYGDYKSARLCDLSGRTVANFKGNSTRLELGGIVPGLYILIVETADGTEKAVKLQVI